METAGKNHYFANTSDGGFTVSGACGHITKGYDFHWLCRNCQLLTTRTLCCVRFNNACDNGADIARTRADDFEKARNCRHNFITSVRDKTSDVKMEWFGREPELKSIAPTPTA